MDVKLKWAKNKERLVKLFPLLIIRNHKMFAYRICLSEITSINLWSCQLLQMFCIYICRDFITLIKNLHTSSLGKALLDEKVVSRDSLLSSRFSATIWLESYDFSALKLSCLFSLEVKREGESINFISIFKNYQALMGTFNEPLLVAHNLS